jgi:hypothetical protein
MQTAESFEEGLLRGIACILNVTEHAVGQMVNRAIVPLDQGGERLRMALQC